MNNQTSHSTRFSTSGTFRHGDFVGDHDYIINYGLDWNNDIHLQFVTQICSFTGKGDRGEIIWDGARWYCGDGEVALIRDYMKANRARLIAEALEDRILDATQ